MKIITNTKRNGEVCYVQLKDILFLSRIVKNNNVMQHYIDFINSGYGDDDFIKINHPLYIEAFKKCDYIVDFIEYGDKNVSINYLSKLLVTINFAFNTDIDSLCVKHKTDGIRDIIAFKKGELDYKIPLIPDGRIEHINDEGTLCFSSTILNDVYVLTSTNGVDVQTIDYYSFYLDCLDKLYDTHYPDVKKEDRDYKGFDRGNSIIITINNKKKKERKMGKILSKIKKGS